MAHYGVLGGDGLLRIHVCILPDIKSIYSLCEAVFRKPRLLFVSDKINHYGS